jgi:hypothetical protein
MNNVGDIGGSLTAFMVTIVTERRRCCSEMATKGFIFRWKN